MEVGTADAEAIADLVISDGVGAPTEDGIGMGVEVVASNIREEKEEFEAKASAEMINRRMTEALEAREANRNLRLRNGNDEGGNGNGDGNKNRGGNGDGNHNRNDG
nr:hypothetical protein [Tanacetum cinerariifolium]